jgi:Cytochrome c554 and c-prime/Doubled CXXCH motif (Paired_CXXCH_1)
MKVNFQFGMVFMLMAALLFATGLGCSSQDGLDGKDGDDGAGTDGQDGLPGEDGDDGQRGDDGVDWQPGEFIGSEACSLCHQETYDTFILTGHPYKLNSAEDAQTPGYYPFLDNYPGGHSVMPLPAGVTWDDVSYVIGGFGWKARFVGLDGYILTGDADALNQYNLEADSWSAYHPGEQKPYDCGSCHTTGYRPEGNQDGLEGLIGTWTEPGIGCEACHGPGSNHAEYPYQEKMTVTNDQELCGSCHVRGDISKIPASGDFIKHHEQFNEIRTSKHSALDCSSCHDPHKSVLFAPTDKKTGTPGYGIRMSCENCHEEETNHFNEWSQSGNHACIDCHMPYAAKSAVAQDVRKGDIRSHLFGINTDPDAEQFYEDDDGNKFASPYLTYGYTCLTGGCHVDQNEDWALAVTPSIHGGTTAEPEWVGTVGCSECHAEIHDDFELSGHPYKLNYREDAEMGSDYYPWLLSEYGLTDLPLPTVDGVQLTWEDVSYVIGGFGWKVRFIDLDGFIVTGVTGDTTQYNLATGGWVAYHTGEQKPYDCGTCHTSGYDPDGHQDNLPGLIGTWKAPGVHCEECHGPAGNHIVNPSENAMIIDTTAAECGRCHSRGDDMNVIPASGNRIKHHEQYQEFLASDKALVMNCTTCHDTHKSTKFLPEEAIVADCEGCHAVETGSFNGWSESAHHDCVTCHMPKLVKSAVSEGTNQGDIRSHIFKFNMDPNAEQFYTAGSQFANKYLTFGYTCLTSGCHDGEDEDWAATNAAEIHAD